MKLREAGAVLLIIGAAVVGPVERQLIPLDGGIDIPKVINDNILHRPRETTAETCARAMNEVGVEKLSAWKDQSQDPLGWPRVGYIPGYAAKEMSFHGWRVLCIPAPSGLQRGGGG